MKDSIKNLAESLFLSPSETWQLQNVSRSWLEDFCENDNERIVKLGKNRKKLWKQAYRFSDHHGSDFFTKAIAKQSVTGIYDLKDPKLISKIVKIMAIQATHKAKLIRKVREGAGKNEPAVSNTESEVTDSSSESNDLQVLDDFDYEPSNATLDTPRLKKHNTRVNAQPGMPLCHSIEMEASVGIRQRSTMYGNAEETSTFDDLSLGTGTQDPSPTRVGDGSQAESGIQSIRTRGRNLASDTVVRDSLALVQDTGARRQSTRTASRSRTPGTSGQTFSLPLCPFVGTSWRSDGSSQLLLRPETINFDEFLDPETTKEFELEDARPIISSLPLHSEKAIAAQCEQTPPSSIRSIAGARTRPVYHASNMDHKPISRGLTEDPTELISGEETSIFVTADHYKVLANSSAATALQSLFDVLNDKSRRYQRLAQRSTGSIVEKKEAERKAIWMCKLLSELKDSRQIWDQYPNFDAAIEIS